MKHKPSEGKPLISGVLVCCARVYALPRGQSTSSVTVLGHRATAIAGRITWLAGFAKKGFSLVVEVLKCLCWCYIWEESMQTPAAE